MIERSPSINVLRQQAVDRLLAANVVDAPPLTAEVILAHALKITRTQLLARLDETLGPDQLDRFQTDLDRVANGEPLAYVVGHREFYDLDLITDRRALIPRPETECLIEYALARFADHPAPVIADIGTGCGAIPISRQTRSNWRAPMRVAMMSKRVLIFASVIYWNRLLSHSIC
jgi:HemK-like putative methylase